MLINNTVKNKRIFYLLLTLGLIYGTVFFYLNVMKYRSFFSFEWEDDAAENQVIYNIATSFNPHQTIFISKYFFGHFTPIYFLVALFYKIYPHIYTWYFLMSFSYGLCVLIVYSLARDILKSEVIALLVALSYLFYAPLHYVNLGTLDGNTFALPLLFLTFYFLYKRSFIHYLIFMVLSCLCKEDIPLVIFMLAVYQLIKKYPKRWWAVTGIFVITYTAFVIKFIPYFRMAHHLAPDYREGCFHYLDLRTFKEICKFISEPNFLAVALQPNKLKSFFLFLYPVMFLPLFSLEFYLSIPLILEVLFTFDLANDSSYYFSPIIPFVFIGAIFILKNQFKKVKIRNKLRLALSCFMLFLCIVSNFYRNFLGLTAKENKNTLNFDGRFKDVNNIFSNKIYVVEEEDRLSWEFIKMVPKNASVIATGDLLPALSSRNVLREFGLNVDGAIEAPYADTHRFDYGSYSTDYILINTNNICNGTGGKYSYLDYELLYQELNKILKNGYIVYSREGSLILYKRIK